MGFFKKLKRAVKSVRKGLGLPAITVGNVAKVAAATAVGGPLAGAGAVLKSRLKSAAIGGAKQVVRTKAARALISRVQKLAPATTVTSSKAVARPGGAPLAAARAAAAPRARRVKRSTNGTKPKRKAPTGGLDLKALSVSWRAAGKPGKWLDWIKSHAH